MLSLKLADFIRSISFADLGQQTIRMARLALLDWLGSVARGGQEEPAVAVLESNHGLTSGCPASAGLAGPAVHISKSVCQ